MLEPEAYAPIHHKLLEAQHRRKTTRIPGHTVQAFVALENLVYKLPDHPRIGEILEMHDAFLEYFPAIGGRRADQLVELGRGQEEAQPHRDSGDLPSAGRNPALLKKPSKNGMRKGLKHVEEIA